jgi:hypothetical protein
MFSRFFFKNIFRGQKIFTKKSEFFPEFFSGRQNKKTGTQQPQFHTINPLQKTTPQTPHFRDPLHPKSGHATGSVWQFPEI